MKGTKAWVRLIISFMYALVTGCFNIKSEVGPWNVSKTRKTKKSVKLFNRNVY